jgi:hypothetical protein
MPACRAIGVQRPVGTGALMHGHQHARQLRVGQALQHARRQGRLLRVVEQPAQQLDQQHIEQAVGQQTLATAHAFGFGKQQGQRLRQPVDGCQRQHHQCGQGPGQRMLLATVEIQRGTDEVGAITRGVVEIMGQWPRVKQQRGHVDRDPL